MIQHRSIVYRNTAHRPRAETSIFSHKSMFCIKTLHHNVNRENCVIPDIMQFFVSQTGCGYDIRQDALVYTFSAVSERRGVQYA